MALSCGDVVINCRVIQDVNISIFKLQIKTLFLTNHTGMVFRCVLVEGKILNQRGGYGCG